jgi:hypothetical protein
MQSCSRKPLSPPDSLANSCAVLPVRVQLRVDRARFSTKCSWRGACQRSLRVCSPEQAYRRYCAPTLQSSHVLFGICLGAGSTPQVLRTSIYLHVLSDDPASRTEFALAVERGLLSNCSRSGPDFSRQFGREIGTSLSSQGPGARLPMATSRQGTLEDVNRQGSGSLRQPFERRKCHRVNQATPHTANGQKPDLTSRQIFH